MKLVFEGTRWPTAQAEPAWITVSGRGVDAQTFTASGKGKRWKATAISGLWRSFADYAATPEGRLRFVQRHGDPKSLLNGTDRLGTHHDDTDDLNWDVYAKLFTLIGADWSQVDNEGISRRTDRRDAFTADLVESVVRNSRRDELIVDFDQHGHFLAPQTLFRFLTYSAVESWASRTSMRRCLHCQDWFIVRNKLTVFCSPACRVAHHVAKQEAA